MNPLLAWIAIVQGLAFVVGCFVAGLILANPTAWILALMSVGCGYLSTLALMAPEPAQDRALKANFILSVIAIFYGVASLASLIWGAL